MEFKKEHKKLFEFVLENKQIVEKESKEKDPKTNEEIVVKRKVEQIVANRFFLRKPNRGMIEDSETYYASEYAQFIKKGLLTRVQLSKRYDDDDGIFSEKQIVAYKKVQREMEKLDKEIKQLKEIKKRSEDEEKQLVSAKDRVEAHEEFLKDYFAAQNNMYEQTAENKARTKTLIWWVLNLAYKNTKEGEFPVFENKEAVEGDNDKTRLLIYDEIEESDDKFMKKVSSCFMYLVSFWYLAGADNAKELKKAFNEFKGLFKNVKE